MEEPENIKTKPRSLKSCLSYAYRSTKEQAWEITKMLWYLFIIFAIVVSTLFIKTLDSFTEIMISGQTSHLLVPVLLVASLLLYSVIEIALFCRLNNFGLRNNAIRFLKFFAVMTFLFLLCFGTPSAYILTSIPENGIAIINLAIKAMICISVGQIFFIILSLPIIYVAGKYFSEIGFKLKDFFSCYKQGFRYIGLIFILQFVLLIIFVLANFAFSLPLISIMFAKSVSVYGEIAMSDSSGLTSEFYSYMFIVFSLVNIINIYITLFAINLMFAINKSISQRISERQQNIL